MTPGNPKKKRTDLTALVNQALRSKGLALPENEDEVAAAERRIANEAPAPLPARLQSPWGFLTAKGRELPSRPPVGPSVNDGFEQELARAARSGSKLTDEVQERMRQDRRAAESEIAENDQED
jgi:hypothetical protein